MALAQTTNQILRSAGEGTEVVANSPITGNGTSEQPLGIDENWHGQDGESVTFTISAIPSGTRVTLSGAQGTESFDVMNGVDGTNGADGAQGPAGPQGPQGDPGVPGETGPQGIQGEQGPVGPQGEQGEQGPAGQDGAPGKSAYEIAVEDGFSGNVYEWLESLKGDPGFSPTVSAEAIPSGTRVTITDAVSSTVFDVMNGEQGPSGAQGPQGPEGPSGAQGPAGQDGAPGADGKNAYELAVEAGFTGTSAEWLDSLVGPQGPEGPSGASGASGFSPIVSTTPITTGTSGTQVTITDLTGSHTFDIMNGAQGAQGPSGESYTGSLMPLIGDNGIAVTSNAGNAVVEISSVAHDNTISGNGTVSSPLGVIGGGSTPVEYTAGANINITDHVISGKDWSDDITAASSYAYNEATAHGGQEYSAGQNINITNHVISGRDWSSNLNSKLDSTTFNTYTAAHTADDNAAYTAGANIDITNHIVSGKDWTNTITAASAYAASQAQGKTYTGVAPIVVNNNEDKISADCIELSAGDGIDSTKLALGIIEVSSQGGGSNFSSSAFGIIPSTQVTALTSLSYYDTGIGKSNQLSGNSTNNLGWTMPSAYDNVKNDIITETMPEVSSHYSYKLSYTTPSTGFTGNSGLEIRKYVGNTGTTRKVLSGNSTLGELVPEDYTSRQYLSTNAAGNMVWDDIANISPIVLVATSGDIPASGATDNKVYIVTGNS